MCFTIVTCAILYSNLYYPVLKSKKNQLTETKLYFLYLPLMKSTYLILLVCIAGCFTACFKKDSFDPEAQFRTDTTMIREFVKKNNIPAIKHSSGIFYVISTPGTGAYKYTASTKVTANYTGRLLDGSIFDSTTGKAPVEFPLNQVIEGWQIGVPLIQNGGTIRLIIPSGYGYGNTSQPLPSNSITDFDITITKLRE